MADTIDLGLVTAYGNAKEGGYTGTESQFNTLLANLPTYASNAAASATAAAASASDAEDAADRAEAIVGGQFVSYGQTQGLSDAQQEQARANISAGASNRNLLDNPWMTQGNVINQRGQASYTSKGYTIDRWENSSASAITSVAVGNNGVTLTKASGADAFYRQYLGRKIDEDATYTLSLMTGDGKIYSATSRFVTGTVWETVVSINGMNIGFGLYGKGSTPWVGFYFGKAQSGTITIKAVKLELGSYSTLANDVPPKKRSALADCQERFLRVKSDTTVGVVGFGSQTQSDRAYILIPTPVTMELNASNTMSVSLTGTARLVGNGSGSINVTSVSFVSREANGVLIACFGSNIAANVTYNLYLTSGSYIDISGDL